MRIIITGAAGQIGSAIIKELSCAHELRLIDRRPVLGQNSILADLARPEMVDGWRSWLKKRTSRWSDTFEGADVVLHLAAHTRTPNSWRELLRDNIQGTWHVIQAAAQHHVSRVVFASSNWAVKALERQLAPACYLPNGPKIGSDIPPCPLTAYGVSKAFGELTGRMFVDEARLSSFIAVRIGSYSPNPPEDVDRRTRWIGVDDIRGLLRRCVEAQFRGFHVAYGVSAQPTVPYDLSYTRHLLSWEPRQLP